jgi:hypothetical protein
MAVKTYPFSTAKHAHDIEFFRNRLLNRMGDMECGFDSEGNDVAWDKDAYEAMEKVLYSPVFESINRKMYGACGRPIWLTGKEIGMAKEIVAWASNTRAATCVKNGRYDLLKYC